MQRRVVVTGLGVISALGGTSGEFWQALQAGRSGIAPIEAVDRALLRFSNGAEVRNYSPARYFDEKEIGLLDRFAQFGAIAAREAVAAAGVEWTQELRESTAIVTGSCTGGQTTEDEGFVNLYRNNNPRVNPFTIPRTMENAAASRISIETGNARLDESAGTASSTWPLRAEAKPCSASGFSKRGRLCAWSRRTPAGHFRRIGAA